MWTFFTAQNCFFCSSPIPLEKVPDLTEFPDLLLVDMLQNLHTLMTLRMNPESMESGEQKDLRSDARSKDVGRTQPKEVLTPASDSTPLLLTELAPICFVSSNSLSTSGKSSTQPFLAHSISDGKCKVVCRVCEEAGCPHTDSKFSRSTKQDVRNSTSVTTAALVPATYSDVRVFAFGTRTPTSSTTTRPSASKDGSTAHHNHSNS